MKVQVQENIFKFWYLDEIDKNTVKLTRYWSVIVPLIQELLVSNKNISFDVKIPIYLGKKKSSGVVIAVILLFTVVLDTQPEIGFGQRRVNMVV